MQKIYREKQFSCGAQSQREEKQERSNYEADNIGRDKATECVTEFPETSGIPGNLLGYPDPGRDIEDFERCKHPLLFAGKYGRSGTVGKIYLSRL